MGSDRLVEREGIRLGIKKHVCVKRAHQERFNKEEMFTQLWLRSTVINIIAHLQMTSVKCGNGAYYQLKVL